MNSLILAFALHAPAAWAGDLEIRSTGPAVMVMRGNSVAGTTPLLLKDLPEGAIELGFRETPLGATVFSQKVQVPATGTVALEVNLPQRTAIIAAATAPVAVAPAATPAPATAAAPAAPPAPAKPAGDIYVTSTPPGAAIWLDGKDSGMVTPNMIRGVDPGKHLVQVRTECTRAQIELTVANGVIARA